jgi:hypothetical protein
MFANLVSSLHQVPGGISKRSAQDMEAEDATDRSVGESNSSVTSKRWDNKKSPRKQIQHRSDTDSPEWQTPDSPMPQQSAQPQRDHDSPQEAKRLSTLFSDTSVEGNMSPSDDEDILMHDSGNESTPKSLTSYVEVEATTRQ